MKTEAIVLSIQKYKDTSFIVHLYTRETGRIQCLLYGKQKFSFFSPLSIVEITTSNGHNKPLDSIKTVDLVYIPIRLKTDVRRQCIALFMAEALYKTLQHPMQDIPVYERLQYWIKQLDMEDSIEYIPDMFLHNLSELLGYGGEPIEELSDMKTSELLKVITI